MNGIPTFLRALYDGERALERDLRATAHHHPEEHEVHHVAADLAGWSRAHARLIAGAARIWGLHLTVPAGDSARPAARHAEPPSRTLDGGLRLLLDLRQLHLAATGNSLNWEMLGQAAQAGRDHNLLDLATACHPRTLRQMRWTNTMIRTLSPQLLSAPHASSRAAGQRAAGPGRSSTGGRGVA